MHELECRDGIDWWPESAPTPINVATLPASGLITSPLRMPGEGQWLGVWGDFAGARIAFSATESFALSSGGAFPYPTRPGDPDGHAIDLYFSKDTGGSGTLNIGRFKTLAAARAWSGNQMSFKTAGAFGPFPAASALTDADPNPTTTRVGSNGLLWNTATWDRWRGTVRTGAGDVSIFAQGISVGAEAQPADGAVAAGLNVMRVESYPQGFNGTTYDRLRVIPSGTVTGRQKNEDAWKSATAITDNLDLGVATNGFVYTVPAGKIARTGPPQLNVQAGAVLGPGVLEFQQFVGSVVIVHDRASPAAGGLFITPSRANTYPLLLAAGDKVQFYVATAYTSGLATAIINVEERWAE